MGLRITRLASLAVAVPLLALAASAGAAPQVEDARKIGAAGIRPASVGASHVREEQPGCTASRGPAGTRIHDDLSVPARAEARAHDRARRRDRTRCDRSLRSMRISSPRRSARRDRSRYVCGRMGRHSTAWLSGRVGLGEAQADIVVRQGGVVWAIGVSTGPRRRRTSASPAPRQSTSFSNYARKQQRRVGAG